MSPLKGRRSLRLIRAGETIPLPLLMQNAKGCTGPLEGVSSLHSASSFSSSVSRQLLEATGRGVAVRLLSSVDGTKDCSPEMSFKERRLGERLGLPTGGAACRRSLPGDSFKSGDPRSSEYRRPPCKSIPNLNHYMHNLQWRMGEQAKSTAPWR